jgi:hypothetical protein
VITLSTDSVSAPATTSVALITPAPTRSSTTAVQTASTKSDGIRALGYDGLMILLCVSLLWGYF